MLCLQLPAGALSDRLDRRLTMIVCDIVRAMLLALLAILVAARLASWPVVGLGQDVPFLADALSYVVSFGTVSRIRGRFQSEKAAGRTSLRREVGDGLRLVWRVPLLRAVVIQAPLVNFAFSGVLFTITLALRQHGTSTAVIGLVQAAIAAGGLLGAVVVMAATALATLAPLIGGLVVEHVSGGWAVGAFAIAMAGAAAVCLILPGLRDAESLAAEPG